MYICLEVNTPNEVDLTEAWLTLFYFFLLVTLAFGFDKLQQNKDKKLMDAEETKEQNRNEDIKIKKSSLRKLAKVHGEKAVITIARGIHD